MRGGKVFRISDLTQIGVLGTINNVNRVGFTGDELSNFNRSSGRGGGWWGGNNGTGLPFYDGGQTPGQNRSIATGINFGRSVGKNGQLTMDYTLFDRQQTQSLTERQAFTRTGQERTTESFQTDRSGNYSHRLGFDFEQELDSTSRLSFEGSGYLTGNNTNGAARTIIADENGTIEDYRVDEISDGMRPGGDISARYNRRVGGRQGRTFGADVSAGYQEDQTDSEVLVDGLNENPDEQLAIVGSLVNGRQFQDRRTNSYNFSGNGRYVEPLSKKFGLESELGYSLDNDEGNFNFRLGEETTTNLLTRQWTSAQAGTGLVFRYGERNNIQIGADVARTQLDVSGDTTRSSRFTYLLPNFSWRLRAGKGNYNLRYNTNVEAPSVAQLQTIAQPTLSGRVTVGNVDLDPATRHNLSSNFWYNDQFRALSFQAFISFGYTDNAFGNSLTFTPNQQIYQTVNVSHAWTNQVYAGTTIGMAFMKGELRLNANGGSSIGQGFVDGIARTNTTTNYSGTADLTTEFNEKSFLKAGYTYSRNGNRFDDEETEEIVTITHDITTQFELELSKVWRFESRLLYRFFEATAFAAVDPIPDLRASFELRPFKTKGHYFILSGEDLLNQNTVVTRQAQAFVTSETVSNGLGRYLLATFHYQL